MQTIPLIYTTIDETRLMAGTPLYTDGKIEVEDNVPAVGLDRLKSRKERGKVIAVDVESLNGRKFNTTFIECCKTPGNDLWIVESIYKGDDVYDAFLGNADRIIFPYADLRDPTAIDEILDLSDSCIPLLVTGDSGRWTKDLGNTVDRLYSKGFTNVMVADMDGSVSDDMWEDLIELCPGLVTYSPRCHVGADMHILAEDVFQIRFSI